MDMLPVDPAHAERLSLGGDEITVLATGAQTHGDLFAVEIRMPPGGGPPLMHRHAPSEIYYVREGEFTFYVGESASVRRVIAKAGDVVPLAGNTPHTIRNESRSDAVAFVVHSPAATMEGFSRAVAKMSADDTPSMERMLAVAEQSGIEMLGPIPALT